MISPRCGPKVDVVGGAKLVNPDVLGERIGGLA
jgi:hypothetical protein